MKAAWSFFEAKAKVEWRNLSIQTKEAKEQVFNHNIESSSEDEPLRMARPKPRFQDNTIDFKVEIPEFEGKLDPEEFLDWLHTVERVFEYKDVEEDKKVKLLALDLENMLHYGDKPMC